MSKERFEWLYNETMLKHYMVDNQNNIQLGYETIVNLLNQQNKQISDLEAKLAESEKEREFLKEENKINKKDADYYFDEYRLCKHQLAEKESTISNLIEDNRASQEWYKKQLTDKEKQLAQYSDINNALNSGLKDRCIFCEEEHNQDKISFCIEKLERLRKSLKHKGNVKQIEAPIQLFKERTDYLSYFEIPESDFNRIFDNQIEELKKGL